MKCHVIRPCKGCGTAFLRTHNSIKFCSVICAAWSRVRIGAAEECWPWEGACDGHGYGTVTFRGVQYIVSRVILTATLGPSLLLALHQCDNPPCCNPGHLYFGTYGDNQNDALSRSRKIVLCGEDLTQSKLTDEQVRQIRALLGTASQTAIGAMFGVSQTAVSKIALGYRWRHVT